MNSVSDRWAGFNRLALLARLFQAGNFQLLTADVLERTKVAQY